MAWSEEERTAESAEAAESPRRWHPALGPAVGGMEDHGQDAHATSTPSACPWV